MRIEITLITIMKLNFVAVYILRNAESSAMTINKTRYYIALHVGLANARILNSISLYQLNLFYSRNLYLHVSYDFSCFFLSISSLLRCSY